MREGGLTRGGRREGKMDGISNQCKFAPPSIITLVYAITHTHAHTMHAVNPSCLCLLSL